MLVKLATVWADPEKVDSIYYEERAGVFDLVISIPPYSLREADYCLTKEDAEAKINELAAIVNAALQTSSFGGEIDQAENPAN